MGLIVTLIRGFVIAKVLAFVKDRFFGSNRKRA